MHIISHTRPIPTIILFFLLYYYSFLQFYPRSDVQIHVIIILNKNFPHIIIFVFRAYNETGKSPGRHGIYVQGTLM